MRAEAGFGPLDATPRAALTGTGENFPSLLRATMTAYARFATENAALLELMYAGKHRPGATRIARAAEAPFGLMHDLIVRGQAGGAVRKGDPERIGIVLFATSRSIASRPDLREGLVETAIDHFLRSAGPFPLRSRGGTGHHLSSTSATVTCEPSGTTSPPVTAAARRGRPTAYPSLRGKEHVMSVTTTTHLNFWGTAREALDFYQSVFGGRTVAITYQDAGTVRDEGEADWVMWGEVAGDDGFHVMAYDVLSQLPWSQGENPFFVSVRGDDAEEITALWTRLAEGSTIVRPLEPAQWAPLYGMLTDRFGVTWVLDVAAPYTG